MSWLEISQARGWIRGVCCHVLVKRGSPALCGFAIANFAVAMVLNYYSVLENKDGHRPFGHIAPPGGSCFYTGAFGPVV
jgi:hypothetical protein